LKATDLVAVVGEAVVISSRLEVPVQAVAALTATMTEVAHLAGAEVAEAELTVVTSSLLEAMAVALAAAQRRLPQNVKTLTFVPCCASSSAIHVHT